MTEGRRLTQRGEERRRQLLDYAALRFAETGYHPTSVADIVGGLGVGKGVFYWYFDSKEELFLELLRESQRSLRRAQRAAIAEETDPLRCIELGIHAAMRWWAEHRHLMNLVEFAATEERFAPAIRRGQDVTIDDIAVYIKDAIATGAVVDRDAESLAHSVFGIASHLARELLHHRGDDADEVAELAVSIAFYGMTRTT